jgi:hypothetical protein
MRASLLLAFALVFLASIAPVSAEDCRCKGCGCKGGAGWRGPDGVCVQKAMLDQTCGNPAGAPCKQEAAARVCFGKQSSLTEPKAAAPQ